MNNVPIYQDEFCVIRMSRGEREIRLTVHEVHDGKEMQPRGYMIGSGSLIYPRLGPR